MPATKYIVGDLAGAGGMGFVHKAVAEGQPGVFAVKQLRPEMAADPETRRRFATEVRVGLELEHPHIARVVDHGETPTGEPFLVMRWVDGHPLGARLAKHGRVSIDDALVIAARLLDALAYAHEHGVVHGDVKADNLLVTGTGPQLAVTLIDWGLARYLAEPAPVATEVVSGTPGYMAPEILRGHPHGISSDIYAAGVVIYELLTGMPPFGGGDASDITQRQLAGEVAPPSLRAPDRGIPPRLDDAVMRALEPDAANRFPGARAFAKAIARGARLASGSGEIPLAPLTEASAAAQALRGPTLEWRPHTATRRRLAIRTGREQPLGDEDALATVSLRRASLLVGEHRLRESARELLAALDLLRARSTPPDVVWPVLLSLAAIQLGLGQRGEARRAALEARELAVDARADVGRRRADDLLAKMR